ncbi:hypothetical protein BC628DRAFT_321833 [Trametes gibbosa]|nr:hypothetical protein BC628DRAFT_321833 [Trametes gibbosa]
MHRAADPTAAELVGTLLAPASCVSGLVASDSTRRSCRCGKPRAWAWRGVVADWGRTSVVVGRLRCSMPNVTLDRYGCRAVESAVAFDWNTDVSAASSISHLGDIVPSNICSEPRPGVPIAAVYKKLSPTAITSFLFFSTEQDGPSPAGLGMIPPCNR